ncbi:endolytic transglycosylase MltG [Candidatus Woesebacteria bacterium]|jgi:UPF0755 protein|nr:endolytic transglycosylase MltG [Candidatus Woesebacteria bacterium]HNV44959.1 endolytic transglycosylase MltG [Candidatus Woesebacteria bacterium]HOA11692.1 endolytic transglycosylase MltG [Candidatus Woesebacteria bacterium]HOC07302.1 endolytic transglycosylase MltG [Candidatus Woesebacteria bacterium]HOP38802.1 endolytic transglycosylase MltG [Candidatus Woesebacteria bacterium]
MKNSPKKPRSFFYFLLIFVIIVISGWAIFISLLQAPNSSDQSTVTFIIPKGEATQNIAQRLKAEGLIRSPLAFRLALYQQGKQTSIQAGSFKLSPSMSVSELTQVLTKGTDDLWITIPEGWRREEIAASLVKQDLSEFDEQEFLVLTDGLEGQLFPDTYLVPKASTTASIVNLLVNTFESKVLTALAEDLASSQLDLNQILTLASLVQRESANEQDMPLIAGILFNRLEINMPLQVDATLQYVKGYSVAEQTWWSNPVAADKNLASAFNTYQNPGLPPQPICNPGLAAIKAVLHPQSTTALYYIHDLADQIHTADTIEGHNANVNQYLR